MKSIKYDFSNVENISSIEYKYSMGAIILLLAIQFGYLDVGSNSINIIFITGLSIFIWWSFRAYFVNVKDKSTAKWLLGIIVILLLFGITNLLLYSTTNLYDSIPTNTFIFSIIEYLFYLVLLSLIAFIIICIKIISTNRHHSLPLKRIAISSLLFIPVYILVTSISNIQFILQVKDVAVVLMADPSGGMLTPPDFVSGFLSDVLSGFIFVWNLIIMTPYYFLFFHFYKADRWIKQSTNINIKK